MTGEHEREVPALQVKKLSAGYGKKLKGVPKAIVKKRIEPDHYKKCVLDNENHSVSINCIRNLKGKLTNFTLKQNKLALSNTDDKRVWDGITSKAYGHYSLKSV